ncbi:DinB family protein [Clostridiaceae bacterium M8S5]|nr:DinB family protein [Clostridiaceae bacterium M8S5]
MLNEYLNTFKANRQLTYDVFNQLTDEQFGLLWSRPGLNTFTKHFKEMIYVQEAFIDAMYSRNMSFESVPDVFEFADDLNKDSLLSDMKEVDNKLEKAMKELNKNSKVKWFDIEIPLEIHILNLINHEVFHQGMMTMAMYNLNIHLPESWKENWALPANEDSNE